MAMKRLHETTWYVRVASLLVAVWAVWLLAFNVWSWNVDELRSGDAHAGYAIVSILAFVVVVVGLVTAILGAAPGEVVGGIVVTGVAAIGSADAVNRLIHWGELVDNVPDRWTSWVLLDSIGSVPYFVLLAAGVLLVAGGIVHMRHPAPGSTPHAGAAA